MKPLRSSWGFSVSLRDGGSPWKQPRQSRLTCRSYLSVVVYLRFLLNVGVELRDVRQVAVRLFTVGVPVAVCRGDRETDILFKSSNALIWSKWTIRTSSRNWIYFSWGLLRCYLKQPGNYWTLGAPTMTSKTYSRKPWTTYWTLMKTSKAFSKKH